MKFKKLLGIGVVSLFANVSFANLIVSLANPGFNGVYFDGAYKLEIKPNTPKNVANITFKDFPANKYLVCAISSKGGDVKYTELNRSDKASPIASLVIQNLYADKPRILFNGTNYDGKQIVEVYIAAVNHSDTQEAQLLITCKDKDSDAF